MINFLFTVFSNLNLFLNFNILKTLFRPMDFTPKAPKKHKSAMSHGTPKFSPPNPGRGKKPSNSPNLSKWQNRKEKRKDKQLVVCTCCFTGKDRNMVKCVRCNKWQHGVCYGIFEPTQIEHVCGPCSVRHNIPCTSEEIRAFCMLRNKTEQQRRDFVLMLMARRRDPRRVLKQRAFRI